MLLFTIIILITLYLVFNQNKCPRLKCLTMNGLNKFQIEDVYEEDTKGFRALLQNQEKLLRVDLKSNINSLDAEKTIKAEVIRMKTLYANATSPYPGDVSNEIACSKEFIPQYSEKEINGIKISYFTGYLNQRLIFGACTPDQAVNRGILALFYCPKHEQMFQIELIEPADKFDEKENKYIQTISSIRCK